jgi:eukaryotic translation initiation factor 2C
MSGYGGGTPGTFHFHLASHAGCGTLNPTFYQVVHDDNELTLDSVVSMTYALSLDSKRCEKS